MKEQNGAVIDGYLFELADAVSPDNGLCSLRMKDILSIRKACAALAYQLYHRNIVPDGLGVMEWKKITCGNEVNDVKNQWVT